MSRDNLEPICPPGDMAYRSPAALPFELAQHVGIFFEEKLYTQALTLLFNTLASGTYASKKAVIPLPQHLALAATFLVHPSTTTRARTTEEKEAANAALRLLRLLSTLVSPQSAKLNTAFAFAHFGASRSGHRRHTDEVPSNNELRDETKALNLELGQSASLWSRAEDFWHAVGWAFNCSVLHPERWERWQIWLQFMCDIIQADWEDRERQYKELKAKPVSTHEDSVQTANGGKGKNAPAKDVDLDVFRDSLIYQYISAGPLSGRNRRILRAIFADGSTTSANEFREVFSKELGQPKSNSPADKANKREREVDIDREQYGDYLSEDETDVEVQTSKSKNNHTSSTTKPSSGTDTLPRRSKRTRRGTRNAADALGDQSTNDQQAVEQASGVAQMGGLASLGLRKRFIGILSTVADRLPHDFIPILELYNLFVEYIRHLPLPIFQAFVNPYVVSELSDAAQTTLCELLLYTMLESSAPETDDEYLNQNKLEQCFLPFAAASASVVSNAKVSILFEALIMLLAGSNMLTVTSSLKKAVEQGILRRAERAQEEYRRGHNSRSKESLEWCWLVESGERLVYLLDLLQPQD